MENRFLKCIDQMTTLPKNHIARISNFYSPKLRELKYFLAQIVENCDESLRRANTLEANTDPTGGPVTYIFSAFTNTVQTLKDITEKLKPGTMPWSKISKLRHGTFIYDVRNAMTHDGNPVISAWVDGHYFVPNKIVREDKHGNIKVIDHPKVNVRQFCLEFTVDFANLIKEVLQQIPDEEKLAVSIFDIDEIDEFSVTNLLIPEFALKMLRDQRSQIEEAIRSIRVPRIENAIKVADELVIYCNENLTGTTVSEFEKTEK